mmetsp:Transcript_11477/g.70565  ORF Transcript_11477/g.70565 Transcript_11477/m.70565 type:complete len:100 (-) Transcript_11477:1923-2222(-)
MRHRDASWMCQRHGSSTQAPGDISNPIMTTRTTNAWTCRGKDNRYDQKARNRLYTYQSLANGWRQIDFGREIDPVRNSSRNSSTLQLGSPVQSTRGMVR